MSLQNLPNLTIQEAHKILKTFDCVDGKVDDSAPSQDLVRQALLLIANHSDYQILGICADTVAEGFLALDTYSKALGYEAPFNKSSIEGPVYIKFNPNTELFYVDSYLGNHRGVLVSCQSYQEAGINDMYGHLPLDLWLST